MVTIVVRVCMYILWRAITFSVESNYELNQRNKSVQLSQSSLKYNLIRAKQNSL